MSGRSTWRRPHTRVYDATFNAGESYYKSALDGLDRKYGGRSSTPSEPAAPTSNGSLGSLRASLERERERPARRPVVIDDEGDIEIPRRKTNTSALLDEFDSIFESRTKNGALKQRTPSKSLKSVVTDDEIDQEFEESMKRIKASRAARAAAADMEEIESNLSSRKSDVKSKMSFSSKIMDSVGMSEDVSSTRRKVLSITSAPSDSEDLTRWTKVDGRRQALDDDDSSSKAVERARKSRARLEDLEAEMAELDQRGAAREKRVRDLRALLNENESNSKETLHSTVRVKKTIKTEKKQVAF